MEKKLLIIYGPTGVGKTSLALELAKKYNGDILSADSRQVYRGMDIITGKDLPEKSKIQISNVKLKKKKLNYWETIDETRIWLTDIVDAKEEFSVAQWVLLARKVIDKVWKDGKLPIIVGGTGFYLKALVDGVETLEIRPNKKLRQTLVGKSADELFETLASVDSIRAANMNLSDKRNPRRLVRAIEVALSKQIGGNKNEDFKKADILMIGLKAPKELLFERIDRRVDERAKAGALEEIKKLLKQGVAWDDQSMTGIGYRELKDYFFERITQEEAVSKWKKSERDYAKRQLLWFRNDPRIKWYDIDNVDWKQKVEKSVDSWYNNR